MAVKTEPREARPAIMAGPDGPATPPLSEAMAKRCSPGTQSGCQTDASPGASSISSAAAMRRSK